jgi:hypothetical protein
MRVRRRLAIACHSTRSNTTSVTRVYVKCARFGVCVYRGDLTHIACVQVLFSQAEDLVRFGQLAQPLPDVRVHGTFKLAKAR